MAEDQKVVERKMVQVAGRLEGQLEVAKADQPAAAEAGQLEVAKAYLEGVAHIGTRPLEVVRM